MSRRLVIAALIGTAALTACHKQPSAAPAVAFNDAVAITEAAPPPGGTWADVVNATAAGGYMMGNPNAKVKLIEIGSLSCPHCRAFEEEGMPQLVSKYVTPGNVSWEFRPYIIHGPVDLAANLVARCNGPKTFFPLVRALYQDQDSIMQKIQAVPQAKLDEIQNLPTNQAFVAMANIMGLQEWAAQRGVPKAKSAQCLSDQKMIDREVQVTSDVNNQYPTFSGTPAFVVNGTMLDKDSTTFAKVEPAIQAALK